MQDKPKSKTETTSTDNNNGSSSKLQPTNPASSLWNAVNAALKVVSNRTKHENQSMPQESKVALRNLIYVLEAVGDSISLSGPSQPGQSLLTARIVLVDARNDLLKSPMDKENGDTIEALAALTFAEAIVKNLQERCIWDFGTIPKATKAIDLNQITIRECTEAVNYLINSAKRMWIRRERREMFVFPRASEDAKGKDKGQRDDGSLFPSKDMPNDYDRYGAMTELRLEDESGNRFDLLRHLRMWR